MKNCPKCGKELFDEAILCPGCGCPVEAAPTNVQEKKTCPKCGKELLDEAVICPGCGCPVEPTDTKKPKKKGKTKKKRWLIPVIIVAAVLVILGTLAAIILHRPDLRLDDIKLQNKIGMILQYGIPTDTNDGYWFYRNVISFYGIPVESLLWRIEDGTVTLFFDGEDIFDPTCDYSNAFDKIYDRADLVNIIPSNDSSYYKFKYNGVAISTFTSSFGNITFDFD